MIIVTNLKTLNDHLVSIKKNGNTIGFVPTMGALHTGHISLILKAKAVNDICVCSIFVNPTQFNSLTDLEKYPKTLDTDIEKLEQANCDYLFLPSVKEMYPTGEKKNHYQLGLLETILEGKYRPGHFQGVCMIVDKLLAAVMPTTLYLGRKDYQQCLVVQKMMEDKKYSIALNICDTVREENGLAMSSRNMRLNKIEIRQALSIIESLQIIQDALKIGELAHIKKMAAIFLEKNNFKVDYVEIADALTLDIQTAWDGKKKLVALVAAYLNEVRLIDNIVLRG